MRTGLLTAGLLLSVVPAIAQGAMPPSDVVGGKDRAAHHEKNAVSDKDSANSVSGKDTVPGAANAVKGEITISLEGVSRLAAKGDRSWRDAEGKKLAKDPEGSALFEKLRLTADTLPIGKDEQGARFLVDVKNIEKDQECDLQVVGAKNFCSSHIDRPDGKRVYAVLAVFPSATIKCDIHLEAAAGQWADVASSQGDPSSVSGSVTGPDGPETLDVLFSETSQFNSGVGVVVTYTTTKAELRIVGIDAQDKIVEPENRAARSFKSTTQRTIVFPGLTIKDLKAVKLQTRTRQKHDIPSIPLMEVSRSIE